MLCPEVFITITVWRFHMYPHGRMSYTMLFKKVKFGQFHINSLTSKFKGSGSNL